MVQGAFRRFFSSAGRAARGGGGRCPGAAGGAGPMEGPVREAVPCVDPGW